MKRKARNICLLLLLSTGGPARSQAPAPSPAYSADLVAKLIAEAKSRGDVRHGAVVFRAPQFACIGCHKIGKTGGIVGPDLTLVGRCLTPEQIVESVLWPKRQVKDEYKAISVITSDGRVLQGYAERENARELVLREPATGKPLAIAKA